jgi:outer membrane receptor protein involved in Fe transport
LTGISVTASRLPVERFKVPRHVSVVPREDFARRQGSTTADLLREESGVLVQKTTHGHGAPIIRGLIGKHVLLLYDGLRLNKSTFRFGANQYLNTVDARSLAGMEIVRGPAAVVYGSDALGGAINLLPAVPRAASGTPLLRLELESGYRSADQGSAGRISIEAGSGAWSSSTGLTLKRAQDLRAGGNIGRQRPTGWREVAFDLHSVYRSTSGARLRIDYLMTRQAEVPRYDKYVSGEFETYIYDPQNRDLLGLTFELPLRAGNRTRLKSGLAYQREEEGRQTRRAGSKTLTRDRDKLDNWGGYAQLSTAAGVHDLSVGGEFYADRVSSWRQEETGESITSTRPTFPDGSKYRSLGFYVRDEMKLGARWRITAGARYSRFALDSELGEPFGTIEVDYDDFTGALSLGYLPREWLHLSAGWARGFRAPNLNDVVVLKYSSSGVDAPSTGLRPESSHNFELGGKINREALDAELFIYYMLLDDLIDRRPGIYNGLSWFDEDGDGLFDPGEAPIYQRFNADRARIYGWEMRVSWLPADRWQLRANASWTWGENSTLYEPLSRIPPLGGMLALRHLARDDFWLELFLRGAGAQRRLSQRDSDDSRIDPEGTSGWVTVNLRAQMSLGDLRLNLVLENLLDRAYKEHGSGIYAPGAGVNLSVRYLIE